MAKCVPPPPGGSGSAQSDMDQETAQFLLQEGATFVFLDVPPQTEFGIDYNSWYVGPNFKGVKMIPPGVHFVYYSAVSDGQSAPRTGFFYNFAQKEVMIKRWDPKTESVIDEALPTNDEDAIDNQKKDMDRFLGAYPYESYRKWVSLTNHISPSLISELSPLCGTISSVTALVSQGSTTSERRQQKEDREKEKEKEALEGKSPSTSGADGLPEMAVVPGTEIRFTKIPTRKYPENATPAQITRYNMDHSYVLQNLMDSVYSKITERAQQIMDLSDGSSDSTLTYPILGEIQFAFVCFLVGQNYDGFEQWKHLVHLLCSCEEAIPAHTGLYSNFITVLHRQIAEVPEDFFVDIVTANNFLTQTLQQFFSTLQELETESGAVVALSQRGMRFKQHLEKKFKWDFTEEPDEYAPVVVT